MTDATNDIPPTDPLPIRAPVPKAPKKQRTGKVSKVSASDLSPDLDANNPGIDEEHLYWIGALPACPSEHLDLVGIHFPKLVEQIIRRKDGGQSRVPLIGSVVRLNKDKIIRMRDRLKRTVIRFRDPKVDDIGVGSSVESYKHKLRRGDPVTLPAEGENEARRKNNMPANVYTRDPMDEPAANYLFAVLCDDQERGSRGATYPEPLSVTGIEWPGELE